MRQGRVLRSELVVMSRQIRVQLRMIRMCGSTMSRVMMSGRVMVSRGVRSSVRFGVMNGSMIRVMVRGLMVRCVVMSSHGVGRIVVIGVCRMRRCMRSGVSHVGCVPGMRGRVRSRYRLTVRGGDGKLARRDVVIVHGTHQRGHVFVGEAKAAVRRAEVAVL